MDDADPVWLVSPHLLVAEAVAVALAAVGTPAEARAWGPTMRVGSDRVDPDFPRCLVVIVDRFDEPERVAEVGRLVQTGDVRVVLVTSPEVATWWGGVLQDERVDLTTDATSVSRLADVVADFLAGRPLLDPAGRESLRVEWLGARERRTQAEALIETLSPQQRRILGLLASGRRVAEVGTLLGVSRGTVRSHVKALRAKLGARSQLEAVAMLHLVDDPEGSTIGLVPRPRQSNGWEVEARH